MTKNEKKGKTLNVGGNGEEITGNEEKEQWKVRYDAYESKVKIEK